MSRTLRARLFVAPLEDRWTPAAAGSLDTAFGVNGFANFPVPDGATASGPQEVFAQPGGGLVVVGLAQYPGAPHSTRVLVRYTPTGEVDPSYSRGIARQTGGTAIPPFFLDAAEVLAVTPDGGLIAARTSSGDVYRVRPDGLADPQYGTNGVATVNAGTSTRLLAAAALPDGRVVLVGDTTGDATLLAVRLLANGQPDPSFGDNGVARVAVPVNGFKFASGSTVAVSPDGRLTVGGSATVNITQDVYTHSTFTATDAVVVRLLADGRPDPAFGDNGVVRFDTPGQNDTVSDVVALSDGRVVLVRSISGGDLIASRLTAAGQPDATYGNGGQVSARAAATVVLPDGRVVFATGSDISSAALGADRPRRLTADGQFDASYNPAPLPVVLSPYGSDLAAGPDGVVYGIGFANDTASVVRLLGTATPYPVAPGTLAIGGTADGRFTPLVPTASGLQPGAAVNPFPNFAGTARTATADVNGDGVPDFVVGAGPGGGPNVQLFDGATGSKFANLDVFEQTFSGGVFVAAADLNGDGKAEVVVTPDQGGGPVVAIFDGAKLTAGQNNSAVVGRFFGIDDPAFRGGARPAVGDVNGDGRPDLVVAAGFGGGPRVALYDGAAVADPSRWQVRSNYVNAFGRPVAADTYLPPKLTGDFFVFEDTLRNGVFVSAGDLNGDGAADVVVGGGPGGGPRVLALDGRELVGGRQTPVANFFAGDESSRGGVRVAVRPGADGTPAVVTGSGDGEAARVRVYTAAAARAGTAPTQELTPFGGASLANGVFVG